MTLDYNDTIVGWIPDPDNDTTTLLYNTGWDDVTLDIARYRISYGRASEIGPTKRIVIESGSVVVDPGPVPQRLTATPAAGGTVRLDWIAGELSDNCATPTGYKVYTIATDGSESLVATVSHNTHRLQHTATTEALAEVLTTFEVRAYRTVSEVDYYSEGVQTTGKPDNTGPIAADAPTIT